jgi:hypothetical protein
LSLIIGHASDAEDPCPNKARDVTVLATDWQDRSYDGMIPHSQLAAICQVGNFTP